MIVIYFSFRGVGLQLHDFPRTPTRAARKDFRILYMDYYKSHLGQALQDFAWKLGYLILYHYGCTTGITQVNDTDCHARFEQLYLEFETLAFQDKQLVDPSDISRTRQEVLDDIALTWRRLEHLEGVRGHKRTGLSNCLQGNDDALITREAKIFWDDLEIPKLRAEWIAEVDHLVDHEGLTFESVHTLVKHPEDGCGEFEEGCEIESCLQREGPDELCSEGLWVEDLPPTDVAEEALWAEFEKPQSVSVSVKPDDDPVLVEDAKAGLQEAVKLRSVLRVAKELPRHVMKPNAFGSLVSGG